MSSQGIEHKVIVITGGSSGIGAALAKHLFEKGAKIAIAARRLEELEKIAEDLGGKHHDRILIHRCDVTKRGDHESLRDATIAKFGKIDSWVNNAGVALTKFALQLTDEDVDLMITANTKSVLYGMQTIIPYYKQQGEGQVINVSSMLGRIPFAPFRAMYSASKAAMNSLTCNVRVDLRNEGFDKIYVGLFSPGVVATDFGLHAIGGGPDSRQIPGAQPVGEVAEVLTAMIEHPEASVDVYSRPAYRDAVSSFYTAEDVRIIEAKYAAPQPSTKPQTPNESK